MLFKVSPIEIYSSLILTLSCGHTGDLPERLVSCRGPWQRWWRFAALSLLSMSRGAVGLVELGSSFKRVQSEEEGSPNKSAEFYWKVMVEKWEFYGC